MTGALGAIWKLLLESLTMNEHVHKYQPTGRSYFKQTGVIGGLGLPNHDSAIEYVTLYCQQCGDTKEIIAKDHRRREDDEQTNP